MLGFETILAFWGVSTLLALAPGPDNLFVLTQSIVNGRSAGIITTCGLLCGVLVHTFAVAFGIAALFQTSAAAFVLLKSAGAVYLLYLGVQAFRAPVALLGGAESGAVCFRSLFFRGILMSATNPKVSLFFLAFLPQFTDPSQGHLAAQFFQLGISFIISASFVFFGISFLAGLVGEWLNRSPRAQKVLNRVSGVVFLGLALKMALAKV